MKRGENESQRTIRVLQEERVVHAIQENTLTAEHILCCPCKRFNLMGLTDPLKQRQRSRDGKGHFLNLASQIEASWNGEIRVDFCKARST